MTWPSIATPRLAASIYALAILALTLMPVAGGAPADELCLLCGERALADVLRNLVLFVPLGFALRSSGLRWTTSVLCGAALSGAVEAAQLFLPDRDPNPLDMVANALGTAAGATLFPWLRAAWPATAGREPSSAPRRALSLPGASLLLSGVASALACTILLGTAWLLAPFFPDTRYYGQWTPDLGHLEHYDGTVQSARLAGLDLPSRMLASDSVRALLERTAASPVEPADAVPAERPSAALRVAWRVGSPPPALAPIFAIHDDEQRLILLVGADGDDLVLRRRTRADALRLDAPDIRFEGALASLPAGSIVAVETYPAAVTAVSRCARLDDRRLCGFAASAASGWSLLWYVVDSASLRTMLDFLWLALLLLPIGLAPRLRHLALLLAPPIAVLLLAPRLLWVAPAPLALVALAMTAPVALWLARRPFHQTPTPRTDDDIR